MKFHYSTREIRHILLIMSQKNLLELCKILPRIKTKAEVVMLEQRTWMEIISRLAAAWRRFCCNVGLSTISTVSTFWDAAGRFLGDWPDGGLSFPLTSFSWPGWLGCRTFEFKTRWPALLMSKSDGSSDGWCIKWLCKSPRESSTFNMFFRTGLFSRLVSSCKSVSTRE